MPRLHSFPSWIGAATTALVLAAPTARAQTPRDQRDLELERPEVTGVAIRGVHSVDQDDLRKSIATEGSHCRGLVFRVFCLFTKSHYFYERDYLDYEEFRRDVLRIKVFYWRRGFRETQVDTTLARDGEDKVKVAFRVTEGPPTVVAAIRVAGATPALSGREIGRLTLLRVGEPFNMLKLDSTVFQLRHALADKGYADATIDTSIAVVPDARTASVAIAVEPRWMARVGAIVVGGQLHGVSKRTVLSSISLHPGDVYEHEELVRSQRALYESNLFTRATIRPDSASDSVKTLHVDVTEAPLHATRVSAGFTTADFVQFEGRYTDYNFFGGARQLSVRAAVGNILASGLNGRTVFRDITRDVDGDRGPFLQPTWHASVDVTQPWFRSVNNSFGAGVFGQRRAAPGVFIDRGYGATASFTRLLALRAPASLSYRFEVTRVEAGDVYFCVNYGVCDVPTIGTLRARQRLSPLALSGTVDRTNDPLSPSRGVLGRVELEHASAFTASDFRYNRALVEASAYRPVRTTSVLAGHVRVGWVNALESTVRATGGSALSQGLIDLLHPRKRFYAGGSQSVRGFAENQLGPRILTIPPTKLRIAGIEDATGDTIYFPGCAPSQPLAQCDPNSFALVNGDTIRHEDRDFSPRPLGGTSLIEGSVEYRFPIWKQLGGAAFVDGAVVGERSLSLGGATGAVTPGAGIRYYSPAGPIRVDVGFNPSLSEDLTVVSQEGTGSSARIVEVGTKRTYAPARGLFSHLTLHLSIGQAF